MSFKKQQYNKTRHSFLLTLFPDNEEKYAVLHLNGFVLVRQYNSSSLMWEVAIYEKESWNNRVNGTTPVRGMGTGRPTDRHQLQMDL